MSQILALEASTQACSVALAQGGECWEDYVLAPQSHTERLLPMVDALLARHGLAVASLDAIAYAAGPGSFTGLRIATGIVQGLAFGSGRPTVAVSTLEAMALSAGRLLEVPANARILTALDARMGEVYWGGYELSGTGRPRCLNTDAVSSPGDLEQAIAEHAEYPLLILGNGGSLLPQASIKNRQVQRIADFYPHAREVAQIASGKLASGESQSALDTQPAYLRTRVGWAKRKRIRS